MRLLSLFFPERRTSAVVARERLKIVLAHERASRDAPDFLPVLQKELLEVIGRYVEIRSDMIRVNLDRSGDTSLLEINVEIDGAQVKPTKNGAAGDGRVGTRIDPGAVAPWVKPPPFSPRQAGEG